MGRAVVHEFGLVNPHIVGIVMKEGVRRAIGIIQRERFSFEKERKVGKSGHLDDYVTSADKRAQKMYVRMIKECFPGYGILAEEQELRVESSVEGGLYFTIDPLDGTKAYTRKQSHGIGTMISLVRGKKVIAACVGDVRSQEIYYFRPDSDKVHRVSDFGHAERMEIDTSVHLKDQYVLLRKRVREHSAFVQQMVGPRFEAGLFKDLEITGGSIGSSMARLWKGEVGGAVLPQGIDTPWDLNPIIGISLQLGFVFCTVRGTTVMPFTPEATPVNVTKEYDTVVVHRTRLRELKRWVDSRNRRFL